MTLPGKVRIVEVGARDGLQNEPREIPLAAKLRLLDDLALAGLKNIEAGSFVNPRWVPQMADSDEVFAQLKRHSGVRYMALTPNTKGVERALAVGADEVAIFTAASETFAQKNTNCSIEESLERIDAVMTLARERGVAVRGYLSCTQGCPYEGDIAPEAVAELTARLFDMGCYEVSLGDTIGRGNAGSTARLLDALLPHCDTGQLAMHCHDTRGQALANILVALQAGIATVDASVAGLGGCNYAPGASGNVATEDVVYMLHGLDIETGVDLDLLVQAGERISATLERANASSVALALRGSG